MSHKHHYKIGKVKDHSIRFDCRNCQVSTELLKQWVRDRVTGRPMPKRKKRS